MRIIAGIVKGRKIFSTKNKGTRPTSDRVKEALFSIIGPRLPDSFVLDLYSGTGNLGLEALSRGASNVIFVDNIHDCYHTIKKNIELLGFKEKAEVLKEDSLVYVQNTNKNFDIIFMDPPYIDSDDLINPVLKMIAQRDILENNGIVVVEHDKRFKPIVNPVDCRVYGSTYLSFYNKNQLLTFLE